MKTYQVAIIGYGRSGRDIHTRLLCQLPGKYKVTIIVDEDRGRREMIQKEMDVQVLKTYQELFGRKDIDFVVNASFSDDHMSISMDLLHHGLSVLTEKPAATNLEQFDELLKAAKQSGTFFQAFQQYRFGPSYKKVKEVITSGVLGRVVAINLNYSGFARRWDWQTIRRRDAGSLLNTGPHPVDQALDLMGFPDIFEVFAAFDLAHTSGDAEDYAKVLLRAKGAPLVEIEISSVNAYSDHTYLVQGTRGTIKGTMQRLDWKYYVAEDEPERPLIPGTLKDKAGKPAYCREELTFHIGFWEAKGEEADDFNCKGLEFYNRFYAYLESGEPFPITHEHIRKQLSVMERAHKQAWAWVAK